MDFALNDDQRAIVENIEELCAGFDLDYWRERDMEGGFPHDFHAALAKAGYLGVALNIFRRPAVVVIGAPEQPGRWLAPLIRGKQKACFGVTEYNTGLNTL